MTSGGAARPVHALLVGDRRGEREHFQLVRLALLSAGVLIEAESDPESAATTMSRFPVDVVVIASQRPAEAAPAIRRLSQTLCFAPVVVMASTAELQPFARAIAAGARGYLLDGMRRDQLAHALERVAGGETVLPRSVVSLVAAELRRDAEPTLVLTDSPLTRREGQVLTLLRQGRTTRQIADALHVEPTTVRTHVWSIVHKLQVDGRAAAVGLALGDDPRPEADPRG